MASCCIIIGEIIMASKKQLKIQSEFFQLFISVSKHFIFNLNVHFKNSLLIDKKPLYCPPSLNHMTFYALSFYRSIFIFLWYVCCETYKHLPFNFELKGRLPRTLFISNFYFWSNATIGDPSVKFVYKQLRHDEDSTSNDM